MHTSGEEISVDSKDGFYEELERVFDHFSRYHTKILLGDVNAKVGRENVFKILSNILLSRLTPYAEEIIGDYQCGFPRNRSTTDYILCICQILEKKKGIQ